MIAYKSDKRTGVVCGAIMMLATIAGLLMLFIPGPQTPYFWLVWPIGGLPCGISAVLIKDFGTSVDRIEVQNQQRN